MNEFSARDLIELAAARGLAVRPLAEAEADWRDVLRAGAPHTTEYLPSLMRYFIAYNREANPGSLDVSVVAYHDERPCAIWPLTIRSMADGFRCGSNMGPVLPPAFRPDLPAGLAKRLTRASFALLEDLCRVCGQSRWQGRALLDASGASEWYRRIMEAGAVVSVKHDLWCDVSQPMESLWSNIRKSYRPLINRARRLWRTETLCALTSDLVEEIRFFHIAVAGRETRSRSVWEAQAQCVNAGEGFVVMLRDDDGRPVGTGIFHCSHWTCSYGTGIYDRNLFDRPIGHLVQMLAIEEMKRRGIGWYRIGRRSYAGEFPPPVAKEQSIGMFKEGFASETRLLLETDCPVSAN
jgi:FemAB family protein